LPATTPTPLHLRADLDLLLADWGIHHLHLSPTNDGARTADLLFAVFRPDDAYLLQILPHGSWTDESLVAIIARNWPTARLLGGPLTGFSLTQPITPDERKRVRRGGVASLIEVDGKSYLPRGQTTAGTAIDATKRADVLMHELDRQRTLLAGDPGALDEQVAAAGIPGGGPGDWRPYVGDDQLGFLDYRTGVLVQVGTL